MAETEHLGMLQTLKVNFMAKNDKKMFLEMNVKLSNAFLSHTGNILDKFCLLLSFIWM